MQKGLRFLKGFVPNYPFLWSFLIIMLIVIMGYFGWYHVKIFQVHKSLYQAVLQGVDSCITNEAKILSNYAVLHGKTIGKAIYDDECSPIPCFPETRPEARSLGKVGNGTRVDYDLVHFSFQELTGGEKNSEIFPGSLEFGEIIIEPEETFCTWQAPGVGNCCVTQSNTRVGSADICCVCQIKAKLVHYPFGNLGHRIWGFKQKEFIVNSQAEAGVTPTGLEKKLTTKPGEYGSLCTISVSAPPPASPTSPTPTDCDPKCECCNPCGSSPSLSDSDPRECDPGCYPVDPYLCPTPTSPPSVCDPATTCCPGEYYPANTNCPCDPATTCCPGQSYTDNPHFCPCDPSITCCYGETYPGNPHCPPPSTPTPSTPTPSTPTPSTPTPSTPTPSTPTPSTPTPSTPTPSTPTPSTPTPSTPTPSTPTPSTPTPSTPTPSTPTPSTPTPSTPTPSTPTPSTPTPSTPTPSTPTPSTPTPSTPTPCDPATTCCPGETYPSNANCPCDPATTCCHGDTHPGNPNCPPPPAECYYSVSYKSGTSTIDGKFMELLNSYPSAGSCSIELADGTSEACPGGSSCGSSYPSGSTCRCGGTKGYRVPGVIGCDNKAMAFKHYSKAVRGGGTKYYDKSGNEIPAATATAAGAKICGGSVTPLSFAWISPSYPMIESVNQFPMSNKVQDKNKWHSWYASSEYPLLVYNPEHDGQITSSEQLFGDNTFGKQWANGYEALTELDLDKNYILEKDELRDLALWFDSQSDGISSSEEVQSLSELKVTKVFLKPSGIDILTGNIKANIGFERVSHTGEIIKGSTVDWMIHGMYNTKEEAMKYKSQVALFFSSRRGGLF